ncbi:MAG TPA: cyclase family protein [Isosphaeraceae bacterium]|jgi:kynurenine formamidase|nr:cyclase family protein [Isosphaeraceae bacterium]
MRWKPWVAAAVVGVVGVGLSAARQDDGAKVKGWTKGKGWGWVWGKDDEVGSLNAMTDVSRASALALAKEGEVFDLGLTYSRKSYKYAGHNPGEIISFRSPEGIERMRDGDAPPAAINPDKVYWHSAALFISDNVATQIDGLAHITAGADHHWYNGFKEADWGGDFGPRKCDATTIPPIVARGVLIDVAAFKKVDALPGHTAITARDLKDTLAWEDVSIHPGDVVLVRTGNGRFWGEEGADHARIAEHDTAGPDLEATRWLVEDQGAMMVGSDTSGFEVSPPTGTPGTPIPVHRYLLVDQGVHLGEFHNLEGLSRARAYVFCYVATTAKIKGTAAGFALRPIALR